MDLWIHCFQSGEQRAVTGDEVTALTKDILLFFHEHVGDAPGCACLGRAEYALDYWDYLSLDSTRSGWETEFLREGCLFIILGFAMQHLDKQGGDQTLFSSLPALDVRDHVQSCIARSDEQRRLIDVVVLALTVAAEATVHDNEFRHSRLDDLHREAWWAFEHMATYFAAKAAGHAWPSARPEWERWALVVESEPTPERLLMIHEVLGLALSETSKLKSNLPGAIEVGRREQLQPKAEALLAEGLSATVRLAADVRIAPGTRHSAP
ncbi:hypothetical protein ACFL59_12115 [Planctomycetota bacterium]